jgi:hypothetical protein
VLFEILWDPEASQSAPAVFAGQVRRLKTSFELGPCLLEIEVKIGAGIFCGNRANDCLDLRSRAARTGRVASPQGMNHLFNGGVAVDLGQSGRVKLTG